MAYGTYFKTEISISRELFKSKQDLEDKILEVRKDLEYWEKALLVFPLVKKPEFEEEELDDLSHWYLMGMGEKLDVIKENTILLFKLEVLLDEIKFNGLDLKETQDV
jgi:hypothetical protein